MRALQAEQKYDEALQVVDQILFLDPRNSTGLLLRDIIGNIQLYSSFQDIQRRKARKIAEFDVNAAEATIPVTDVMEFPTDWPAKSFERGDQGSFSETPEDRRVLGLLETKKIQVDFKENNLSDVLEFKLPNGWTMGVSNERYFAFDGACYEDRGVPPHVEAPMMVETLDAGTDPGLEAAMRIVKSGARRLD